MVEVTQERVVQAAVGGRGTICGSLAVRVMGVSRGVMKGAISEGQSSAIAAVLPTLELHGVVPGLSRCERGTCTVVSRQELLQYGCFGVRCRLPASRGLESAPGDGGKGGGKVGHVGGSGIIALRTHVRKRLLRRRLPASRGLESAPGDGGKGGGKVGHVGGSIVGLRLSSCSQNKVSTTEPVASSTASSNVNGGRWSANHR